MQKAKQAQKSDYQMLAPDNHEAEISHISESPQEEYHAPHHAIGKIDKACALIRDFALQCPEQPGCYRMFDGRENLLYVGKAKNLKKRVISYSNRERQSPRILRMISETSSLSFTITPTEMEALLLESNLIKQQQPRYNILLKDDKSMPRLLIRRDHDFPQMVKHRGSKDIKGDYFGPFPSTMAVNRAMIDLQKIFKLRDCSDNIFKNHQQRPCMRYQIKRCSAPCAGLIGKQDYQQSVDDLKDFLSGNHESVRVKIQTEMQQASDNMEYEKAGIKRDQLKYLASLTRFQRINLRDIKDIDVVALVMQNGQSCITVFFYRGGCLLGHRNYFPKHSHDSEAKEIIASFLAQLYAQYLPPRHILINEMPDDIDFLSDLLSARRDGKLELAMPHRGERKSLMEHAVQNATQALQMRAASKTSWHNNLTLLQAKLNLPKLPERIEIYDNSHIQGSHAASAMVVAGSEGLMKQAYRKFHIKQIREDIGGDDYAMMHEVMYRRFTRYQKQEKQWAIHPDILLIDGGKGQVQIVKSVLDALKIDNVYLLGIAKGKDRNAGKETFCLPDGRIFTLPDNDPLLFFLQNLRDEAHRYALGAHQQKRSKQTLQNPLDEIEGIGATRKKQLLQYFGSAKEVKNAALEDLQNVPGLGDKIARKIYAYFRH
ncbi:MAG: excinuclease ABC subunit UvrC [Alphaproteobacteria bacterium]|nr:excinuclease ABC subunit UvrC [Alphaproteobacteria bacterium]